MNLKLRRLYFLIIVLFFALIAPLLLYYTRGWRYDFETHEITRTGSLSVTTRPSSATVYIDGESVSETPLKALRLAPGSYTVTVSKKGYIPREQSILIHGGEGTVLDDVNLFPESTTIDSVLDGHVRMFKESSQKNLRVSIVESDTDDILYIQSVSSDQFTEYARYSAESVTEVLISPFASSVAIARVQNGIKLYDIYDVQTHQKITLTQSSDASLRILWDMQNDDLYVAEEQKLTHQRTGEHTELPPFSQAVAVEGKQVLILTQRETSTVLERRNFENMSAETNILLTDIPVQQQISVLLYSRSLIIENTAAHTIDLYERNGNQYDFAGHFIGVSSHQWDIKSNRLLVASENEITLVYLGQEPQTLIRSKNSIQSYVILPEKNSILYLSDGSVYAVDISHPESVITVITTQGSTIASDENGKFLFIQEDQHIQRIPLNM